MMKPLTTLINAIGETVDRLTLPAREKRQLEAELTEKLQTHVEKLAEEQSSVLREEARGNWLQRSWRPLVMLTFATIILTGTFVSLPTLADTSRFWDLLEIGLGGYVIGRGGEKILQTITRKRRRF
ncbi:3TM-type holin [Butyricimonas sp.]|uniref:3TM-type holin n=1 Tax=unclassified Butyricimonas TaxID=2637652 RepID=UPI0034530F42